MGRKLFTVQTGLIVGLLIAACNPQATSPEAETPPQLTALPSPPTATAPIEPSEAPTLVPTAPVTPTPTLVLTSPVTPTPTAQIVMVVIGTQFNLAGVNLYLDYAFKQDKYELLDQNFQRQVYQPDNPDDLLLIVEASVDSGDFERISQWVDQGEVFVVDENGRKDLPSDTIAGTIGGFPDRVLWMFPVSGTASTFTLNLPDDNRFDLSFFLGGGGDLSQYQFSPSTGKPSSEPP